MDELKKYLQQHAQEMDKDEPSPAILQRIISPASSTTKARIRPIWYRMAAVASVALLLVFAIKYYNGTAPQVAGNNTITTAANTQPVKEKNYSINTDTASKTAVVTNPATGELVANKPVAGSESYKLLRSFEQHYNQLVSLQEKSIRQSPVYGESDLYFDDLKAQLRKIDRDETMIKTSIQRSGLTDALLSQLITLYQQKIDLLKNIQSEINRINQKVKENHAPGDTLVKNYINI